MRNTKLTEFKISRKVNTLLIFCCLLILVRSSSKRKANIKKYKASLTHKQQQASGGDECIRVIPVINPVRINQEEGNQTPSFVVMESDDQVIISMVSTGLEEGHDQEHPFKVVESDDCLVVNAIKIDQLKDPGKKQRKKKPSFEAKKNNQNKSFGDNQGTPGHLYFQARLAFS